MKTETVKTTLMISPENLKKLKYQSADEKRPVSEILDEILSGYYKENC